MKALFFHSSQSSINRNIVECKDQEQWCECSHALVLIETLWNVKRYIIIDIQKMDCVLIETLWNVKSVSLLRMPEDLVVLIETLWNVKKAFDALKTFISGY